MRKADMIDIKDILRQRHGPGLTRDDIAAAAGVGAGTVSNALRRAEAAGLSRWPLPDGLDDGALRERPCPRPTERDIGHVQPDWAATGGEYRAPPGRRRARLTQRQLRAGYRDGVLAEGGRAYGRSQFRALPGERLEGPNARTDMRFDYAPGLYGMSDFSGKTLSVRTATGEADVEIFVAVPPHSNLIHAEAVPDRKTCHWVMAHRRAPGRFGGSPRCWIVDNLRSGVARADREDPRPDPSFREFAGHYGVAVLPARSGKPRDKGRGGGGREDGPDPRPAAAAQRDVPVDRGDERRHPPRDRQARRGPDGEGTEPPRGVRGRRARGPVAAAGGSVGMGGVAGPQGGAERSRVLRAEPLLGARGQRRAGGRGARRRAHARGVRGEGRRAPRRPSPQDRAQRIRDGSGPHARPSGAVRDIRSPDHRGIPLARARRIGENALARAERCMASRDFPERAYAAVRGTVRLAETHGCGRVDAARAEALDANRLASGYLRDRLGKGAGPAPRRDGAGETIPAHANVRGGSHYSKNRGERP